MLLTVVLKKGECRQPQRGGMLKGLGFLFFRDFKDGIKGQGSIALNVASQCPSPVGDIMSSGIVSPLKILYDNKLNIRNLLIPFFSKIVVTLR